MEDVQPSQHQLWVNLSSLGEGNIFALFPRIMEKKFTTDYSTDEETVEPFEIILPSNDAWQTKVYYKLVEKQRTAEGTAQEMLELEYQRNEEKFNDWNIIEKKKLCDYISYRIVDNPKNPIKINSITWTVNDLGKAGCLLTNPPLPTTFEDEQEMRRVYTLIYDVFRYKSVLLRSLQEIAFFQKYPELSNVASHVWLLFYDLYHRNFKKRENAIIAAATKALSEANLMICENALWAQRIKLAASISRLRIHYNALSLSDLLPSHLRDERLTGQSTNNPVTCWVNVKKLKNVHELCKQIETAFNLTRVDDLNNLGVGNYRWDKHCPQIVTFHSSMRSVLAKSNFVQNHKLIVQDKSFCLGPATFNKIVKDLELCGNVIQSHITSPRTTAYLANLLSQNVKVKKLFAFNAGKRKNEYENYFNELGMTNILIFSDKLIDIAPNAEYLEEIVAVFATPPNSYSAVKDPIDLVCSRGGDLSMLEVLTESEETHEGKERVSQILDEQRKTLKFAMSRPQIQFVLYETHSELDAENDGMVQRSVKEVNRIAKLLHAASQSKVTFSENLSAEKEVNTSELTFEHQDVNSELSITLDILQEQRIFDENEKFLKNISVPDSDIFDVPSLPSLCPNENACLNLSKEGCYLALLQRKEIIKLDHKYMIQMAENRGLFGKKSNENIKTRGNKVRKKQEKTPLPAKKVKRRLSGSEVERIAAPTFSYLKHTTLEEILDCPRCQNDEDSKASQSRRWWLETMHHIYSLKSKLIHQKITSSNIDEIVANSATNSNIPLFPKLKLTRKHNKHEKAKLQVPVTLLEFPFPLTEIYL